MEHRGINDEMLANRLDRARETINRWRNYPSRLDPDKLTEIAYALDCEPADLFRSPDRPDLNAIMEGAPDEIRATVMDVARRLVGRR